MESTLAPLVIRASAGTGKTTELTTRYLSLLLRGERIERILATTFTRKAAFEIKDRVLRRLIRAAYDSSACKKLAVDTKLAGLTTATVAQVLADVLQNLHRFEICTLDSFISKIAISYSFELGMPGQWRIENENALTELFSKALSLLCNEVEPGLLRELVEILASGRARRSVASVLEKELRVLSEVYRESDPSAWNWAQGKGVRCSAEEIEQYLLELRALELPRTKAGAVSKFWDTAIEKLGIALEKRDFKGVLASSLVEKVFQNEEKFASFVIPAEVRRFLETIMHVASQLAIENMSNRLRALHVLLGLYRTHVSTLKAQQAVYTFDDIKQLFDEPAIGEVLDEIYYRIDCQIAHVLLDEFQDTSRHEWKVIQPMVAEILSKASGESSFFCVGDVKQAIYGWRGGVAEIFDELQSTWPQLTSTPFDTSYRCSAVVLDFVNAVFNHIPSSAMLSEYRAVQAVWQSRFSDHSAGVEKPGFVAVLQSSETDLANSLALLAPELQRIVTASSSISIGVLVRSNEEVSSAVRALVQLLPNVTVSQEGGVSYASFPVIALVISFFELLDHPGNTLCWFHIRRSALTNFPGAPLDENLANRKRSLRHLRRKLQRIGYPAFVNEVCRQLEGDATQEERRHLVRLRALSQNFRPTKVARPAEFARWIELQKNQDSRTAQVRVMTVHQSKGLEFDAVFLPALTASLNGRANGVADVFREDPLAPPKRVCLSTAQQVRRMIPEAEEAEFYERSRRVTENLSVLYVALTRARHALYLALPASAGRGGHYGQLIQEMVSGRNYPSRTGDAEWFLRVQPAPIEIQPAVEVPSALFLSTASDWKLRPEHKSASGSTEKSRSVKSLLSVHLQGAVARGLHVHKILQDIEWVHPDVKQQLIDQGRDDGEVEEVLGILSQPALAPLFEEKQYRRAGVSTVRVHAEKTFAFFNQGALFSGAIDRLVLSYDDSGSVVHAAILDYKTDRVTTDLALAERTSLYAPQMQVYKDAVQNMYAPGYAAISAHLVFLWSGQVIAI